MQDPKPQIIADLDTVEQDERVVVLLAVESGSRAWGFPSMDSDFDVRFVYVHNPQWYLSIDLEDSRDVIERPLRDKIDLCGWDIRKTLKLFRKSNPPLLEWLQCPIIYRERFAFAARLRALLPAFFSPQASLFHYLHMAQGNFREYLRGDSVWRKKYFYVLRPLLAVRWIEEGRGPVPMEFGRLLEATVSDSELRRVIDDLVAAKIRGVELDYGPPIPALSKFLGAELSRLESKVGGKTTSSAVTVDLNHVFRETLEEAWIGRRPA